MPAFLKACMLDTDAPQDGNGDSIPRSRKTATDDQNHQTDAAGRVISEVTYTKAACTENSGKLTFIVPKVYSFRYALPRGELLQPELVVVANVIALVVTDAQAEDDVVPRLGEFGWL